MAQQRSKRLSWKSYLILVVTLFAGWWIYQSIWGFGGIYTHINHIPAPENRIESSNTTPFDIDAAHQYFRLYEVELTLEELVAFNQQALPQAGWDIIKQGPSIFKKVKTGYCIIAKQKNITAYIWFKPGTSQSRDIGSSAFIYLYNPSFAWCNDTSMEVL